MKLHIHDGLEELEYSRPEWMEAAYDHVLDKYGTFRAYFLAVGLTKKEIRKIRQKMIV